MIAKVGIACFNEAVADGADERASIVASAISCDQIDQVPRIRMKYSLTVAAGDRRRFDRTDHLGRFE